MLFEIPLELPVVFNSSSHHFRAKLEKMPSIPEEPEVPENEVERFTMPDFIKPLYDLDVIEGKEAVLKCKVAGLPYPTIAWFHNGKRIESTEDRKMTQCKFCRMDLYSSDFFSILCNLFQIPLCIIFFSANSNKYIYIYFLLLHLKNNCLY